MPGILIPDKTAPVIVFVNVVGCNIPDVNDVVDVVVDVEDDGNVVVVLPPVEPNVLVIAGVSSPLMEDVIVRPPFVFVVNELGVLAVVVPVVVPVLLNVVPVLPNVLPPIPPIDLVIPVVPVVPLVNVYVVRVVVVVIPVTGSNVVVVPDGILLNDVPPIPVIPPIPPILVPPIPPIPVPPIPVPPILPLPPIDDDDEN